MGNRAYCVYILSNASHRLYVGVTGDLERRIAEHKTKSLEGFSSRYNVTRLVHCEVFGDIRYAIAREKQIKGWLRSKKIALIEAKNPRWTDLAANWYAALKPRTLSS